MERAARGGLHADAFDLWRLPIQLPCGWRSLLLRGQDRQAIVQGAPGEGWRWFYGLARGVGGEALFYQRAGGGVRGEAGRGFYRACDESNGRSLHGDAGDIEGCDLLSHARARGGGGWPGITAACFWLAETPWLGALREDSPIVFDGIRGSSFDAGMTTRLKLVLTCACLACQFNGSLPAAQSPKVVELWPGAAPGDKEGIGEEHDTTKPTDSQVAGKPVVRLGNVSKPTLTLYRPAPGKDSGAVVMVCPGGGYSILAMDLEGTEICEWLNSLGITGALLKYRVPKRPGFEKHVPALQDAQRALGLLRHQSRAYGIDPKRIGVLGFSAGAHLAAALSNGY